MSPAETIERVEEVEFFNMEAPGDAIFIARDPNYDKLENKALAQDKYATFRAGLFSTSDPEIIAALNSPALRAKGVRCKANPEDMAEYGSTAERQTYMEQEIARRVAEEKETWLAEQTHASASPFETSEVESTESVVPAEE